MGAKKFKLRYALGGLVAAGALLMVGFFFIYNTNPPTGVSSNVGTPTVGVQVVVATTTIPAGTELSDANLGLSEVAIAPTGSTSKLGDLTNTSSPYYARLAIPQGQVITNGLLVTEASQAGSGVSNNAPLPLANGQVAMSIPYDPSKDVGGFIQAGDYIDVLVNNNGTVIWALQDIQVYSVGASGDSGTPNILVVFVTRDQASQLAYLESVGSSGPSIVGYVLRPEGQDTAGSLSSPTAGASSWNPAS